MDARPLLAFISIFRWMFHLEKYITIEHFKKLSLLLLVSCFAYMYFVINEYMGPGYTGGSEQHLLSSIFSGVYAMQFWSMVVIGLFVPGFILALPKFRTVKGIVVAAILVNIGMWLKRFIIVVPTLSAPFMPPSSAPGFYLTYIPTWVEWAITASAFAASCLFYIIFSKISRLSQSGKWRRRRRKSPRHKTTEKWRRRHAPPDVPFSDVRWNDRVGANAFARPHE